ncbi:dipeptidase [Limoniibacter endophyticus]|uniref:Dipeptidase n=1 Tax=Limoniibacter endophyticus TaxID=1565040 RepID=A0A8J3DPH6_9HYPH|nr:dipeptidase [Limoniibacter endophyticus]GHC63804.1 dipeptidase [Limoniibacter endophyticus]
MSTKSIIPVFDGHNDVLLRMHLSSQQDEDIAFINGKTDYHIDLPKAKQGGLVGGLCAMFVPSPTSKADDNGDFLPPLQSDALNTTMAMAATLARIEKRSLGALKICLTAADIRNCIAAGSFAAVMHIEGAEAIDPDLDALHILHRAGLRTLGPVWSRPNIFAYGVPFRFPSTPQIGPGLTDIGRALVRTCNELKIMIDLSHMNEQGFWDIARLSDAPLVASHSNVHALTPHSRNLTDDQLDAIKATGGLVGVNFGVLFLRQDGRKDANTPLEMLVRHVDYLVDRVGIDHVALGSDFDGTTIPAAMRNASDLPKLIEALRDSGYNEAELRKLGHENWIKVLARTWGQ